MSDSGIRGLANVERIFTRLPKPPGVRFQANVLGGVPAVAATSGQNGDDAAANASVLYLPGGGFMFCGPGTHRRICSSLALKLGIPVHSVDYRKLPDFGVGTAVEDAYAAYRALLGQAPTGHRIVVAGDSAGGFLAAKICELAELDGLRPPAAMVGFSPLLDMDGDARDGSWSTRDAYQPARTIRRAQRLWDRGPQPLRGSRAILEVDPQAFPPSLFTTAAGEILDANVLALTRHLREAGRHVVTHRWRSGVHAFPVLDALTPESRQAGELTVEFLRTVLDEERLAAE